MSVFFTFVIVIIYIMIFKPISNDTVRMVIRPKFDELGILKHLRQAGMTKTFGFSCGYLF